MLQWSGMVRKGTQANVKQDMDEQVATKHTEQEIQRDIEAFAARYPFKIDDFQLEAMAHLANEQSVMVTAPTGTGKTLVAEYAVWLAQKRGQRVIYTTPLKALSNQKYRDMRILYGNDAVGLVTGDIVEHSNASIVIMTTEVYRNMLLEDGNERFNDHSHADGTRFPTSSSDIGFVVFDELHYLSDVGRGPVWEEAIICSPPHVQLVGLSATMSNAEDLADWISRVHRPVTLITHEQRAVPLEHYYFLDGKLYLAQDADGNRVEYFPNIGGEAKIARASSRKRFDEDEEDEEDLWETRASQKEKGTRAEERQQESEIQGNSTNESYDESRSTAQETGKTVRRLRKTPEPEQILTVLRDADLLPCLYFLPGRRVVEDAAMGASHHSFTTPEEEIKIREEIGIWLDNLPKEDRNLQQVHALIRLLPRGLAFHHAGLLPGLKVLVETLFAQGYLRAVFATDTLALGINMPARSVIVGSLSKFDGQEMRLLTPNEYRQQTGRAGRRGMDTRGAAIIPYSPWEQFEPAFQRITGELMPVTSSFVIRYNSVLNLWRPGDMQHLRRICASSLREYQRYVVWEINELQRLEKRYQKAQKKGKKKGAASHEAEKALEKRREKIGSFPLSRAGAAELDGTVFSLRALGYIGQDEQLTLKGRLLRNIFHPSGILIIETILSGFLDELLAPDIAEVCSWFTYDNDRRLNNRGVLPKRLMQVRRELWRITQHVRGIEERAGVTFTPGIIPDFHGLALSWSQGMSLNGLLRRIDLAEGDILMLLNQTIDLIQQVQSAVGQVLDAKDIWEHVSPLMTDGVSTKQHQASARIGIEQLQSQRLRLERLRPLLAQASTSLLHGIIVQSRTVPSMVATTLSSETFPLDAEEDRDMQGLSSPEVFGDL
jgi:ATP-dependent RNA helicase HelY